jgi:recombinational DNA repair protein (RecF pathway)
MWEFSSGIVCAVKEYKEKAAIISIITEKNTLIKGWINETNVGLGSSLELSFEKSDNQTLKFFEIQEVGYNIAQAFWNDIDKLKDLLEILSLCSKVPENLFVPNLYARLGETLSELHLKNNSALRNWERFILDI